MPVSGRHSEVGTARLPAQVADSPAWDLAVTLGRIDGLQRRLEQQARLGVSDRRLMWLLSDRRPRNLRGIADELGLEQSTVNRQVNTAIRAGLLRRYREPGEPALLVTPTAAGMAQFQHDLDLSLSAYSRALHAVGDPRAAQLIELLHELLDGYAAAVENAVP